MNDSTTNVLTNTDTEVLADLADTGASITFAGLFSPKWAPRAPKSERAPWSVSCQTVSIGQNGPDLSSQTRGTARLVDFDGIGLDRMEVGEWYLVTGTVNLPRSKKGDNGWSNYEPGFHPATITPLSSNDMRSFLTALAAATI